MPDERQFDLYAFVHKLVNARWINEVYLFGSRRYHSNASYGSDIDLLIIANRAVAIGELRQLIDEPYVDAFLLDGKVAISAGNETRIPIGRWGIRHSLDGIRLWTRKAGWQQPAEDYRILKVLSNRIPAMTVARAGASPIIIFSALATEFDAVIKRLSSPGKPKTHRDLPPHFVTHLDCASGHKRLVVVVQTGVASVNAAIAATRMFGYFDKVELAVLVGITAGLRDRSRALGDVLVPTATVDVESGKVTPKGKQPAGLTIQTSPHHQRAIASWQGTEKWALKWKRKSPAGTAPTVHSDCTIACTASVIGYDKYAESYLSQNRKIAGIEMEAMGVGSAATINQCPLLIVKAISDWADEEKTDLWHQYCMEISADLVVSMLEDETL